MQYLLLSHDKNGYANAPECYIYTYIAGLIVTLSSLLCLGLPTIHAFQTYFHVTSAL